MLLRVRGFKQAHDIVYENRITADHFSLRFVRPGDLLEQRSSPFRDKVEQDWGDGRSC